MCVCVFQLESFHTALENSNNDFCLKRKKEHIYIKKKGSMKQREGLVMLINVLVCTYVRPFETAFFFSSFSLGKSDTCVFYGPYTRLFFFLPFSELQRKQPHTHTHTV